MATHGEDVEVKFGASIAMAEGLIEKPPVVEEPDPWRRRETAILAERQRFADIVATRSPSPEEIAAHTAEIDRLIREGHRA
jgi:hypothetical protein